MAIEIKVPTVGESITEGTLARWLKRDGDRVEEGEALFELETDKATGEVPAPAAGVLKIQSREGETVVVGAVVGTIEEADGKATPASRQKPKEPPPKKEVEAKPDSREAAPPAAPLISKQPPAAMSPPPTELPSPRPATPETEPASPGTSPPNVPLRFGEGSKGGEVSTERETRKPMSRLRRTIAQRLVQAQHTAAILTTFNEADMSQVSAIRGRFKDAFREKHGVGLGFMSFFVKAAVEALKDFPEVNARIDGDDVVFPSYYDIGVAVSTERGLLVPVLRDADRLTFAQIERAISDLAGRARDGKITLDELRGGTFTITNGGVFGSLLSTPILNPPQSAILGMHAIQKRPVAVDDQIVIRPMMYLALSYDHRLIDGREAVQFLARIKECIEGPERLVLGL